jgi:hypothetical protein
VAESATSLLNRLERLKHVFGEGVAVRKLELLRRLERRRLARAADLLRLHECLCFWRAYPDDAWVLAQVERMLETFAERSDLHRHGETLADSGIAGTPIHYSFFWPTALWLARHWPDRLSVDWEAFEEQERLSDYMHLLVPYCESPALDMLDRTPAQWIQALKGPGESDATFLIRRFDALRTDSFGRETLFESFDVPFRLEPGPGTPARGLDRAPRGQVVFQEGPLSRARPDLRKDVRRPPLGVRFVSPREGEKLISLARAAMVTRARDLEVFAQADRNDVGIVDCGEGLQFVCYGAVPERRLMLEAVYGFLTLKNGVPIGYVLASSLFESTEVAYNVFDTYRGAEAAPIFGRVLAICRHLFGARAFSIDPYQLGYGNAEGLQSGAWWFYYKMGFRPEDPGVKRVLRGELARMKKNPRHRSSPATLEKLAAEYMFLRLDRSRSKVLGGLALGNAGLRVSAYLAGRFGADREAGLRACSREAAQLLGLRSQRGFSSGERLAWERWSPLVLILPGLSRWTTQEKRALVDVVRAKGGRREAEFVSRFDRHARLRRAVLQLTEDLA